MSRLRMVETPPLICRKNPEVELDQVADARPEYSIRRRKVYTTNCGGLFSILNMWDGSGNGFMRDAFPFPVKLFQFSGNLALAIADFCILLGSPFGRGIGKSFR